MQQQQIKEIREAFEDWELGSLGLGDKLDPGNDD